MNICDHSLVCRGNMWTSVNNVVYRVRSECSAA